MYITKDGHKLSGDEIEVDDNAVLVGAWLLEIFSDKHKLLGTEILKQSDFPTGSQQLYWVTRYEGNYVKLSRIRLLDYALPFGNLDDEDAPHFLENDPEYQGYLQYKKNPDDPVFHMDE